MKTRTRRKLDMPTPEADLAYAKITELAITTFVENKLQNEHKRKYDKSRKELLGQMKDSGKSTHRAEYRDEDGKSIMLVAEISTPTGQAVDVTKLQKLVTEKQFLAIVEASQKAVTDIVGTATLAQCLVPTIGTENVSVKVAKL
jgi:hypothetical protein